ncbi:hypothetical protein BH11PSE4_BH11PSE4_32600 [soil metagenome]
MQPQSRARFCRLLKRGRTDALRAQHPDTPLYTFGYWESVLNATPDCGWIILLSPQLAPRLTKAGVDRKVRGMDNASDHAPAWIVVK